jgi:hypothetical protein
VRHEHERDAHLAVQCRELVPQRLAQFGVECAQRFVEQQHGRTEHERTRQRDPLLLPARELMRTALGVLGELHQLERLADALSALGLVDVPLPAQAVGHVVLYRHVREQCIALEDRVDRPLVRRYGRYVEPVDEDRACGRLLESGDHPQRRRLAAAGWPDQREELSGLDPQRQVVDSGMVLTERLGQTAELDGPSRLAHVPAPSTIPWPEFRQSGPAAGSESPDEAARHRRPA